MDRKSWKSLVKDGVRHTPKGTAHRGRSTEDYIRDLEEIAGRVWLRVLSSRCLKTMMRVSYGQVKRREGRLGLALGLVLSLEQYFCCNNIFYMFLHCGI